MTDNIIPFPNFGRRDRLEQSDDEQLNSSHIAKWSEGLQDPNPKVQWDTYDQMFGFLDSDVRHIIENFLISIHGDYVLKTRFLQKFKLLFPNHEKVEVTKGDSRLVLTLSAVPIEREEWPIAAMEPYYQIQEYAYNNPSLIEMAQELWVYYLEKSFPFIPELTNSLLWTAAIHYYVLGIINDEWAREEKDHILKLYDMNEEELLEIHAIFEQNLWKV